MSNIQYAYLKRDSLPSAAQLQSWIDDLGFDLQISPDLKLETDEGFSPCVLEGAEIGLELGPCTTEELIEDDPDVLSMAGQRDFCVSMSWRGSMKDCAAVLIVSCALAKHCDAVISYEGEPPETFEAMLEGIPSILEEARTE